MASVLVIESDSLHLELLTFLLKQDGHRVFTARDAKTALEVMGAHTIDLVTIETGSPYQDGVRSCQRIRQLNPWLPLIIVSDRGDEEHVVRGLGAAADDYIRKPFSPHELLARVRALLRRASLNRASLPREDSIAIGEVILDQQHMSAIVNGRRVPLTPRELSLLRVFMQNPDRVLSRDQLMALAWGDDFVATRKAVDVYVLRLRKKIRPHLTAEFYVRSLRGFGYVFAAPMLQLVAATADESSVTPIASAVPRPLAGVL
jgi:DNA-binding response OmpR family regulator